MRGFVMSMKCPGDSVSERGRMDEIMRETARRDDFVFTTKVLDRATARVIISASKTGTLSGHGGRQGLGYVQGGRPPAFFFSPFDNSLTRERRRIRQRLLPLQQRRRRPLRQEQLC